jgi:UDP-GlcNAc:undecaprenyl-phosphate GlcNAc-1-phosphate transferase
MVPVAVGAPYSRHSSPDAGTTIAVTVLPWWAYVVVFASAALLALVLTPLARALAIRLKIVDQPGDRKQQEAAVPCMGGLAIVVSFSAVVGVTSLVGLPGSGLPELAILLALGVGIAVLGMVDDIRSLTASLRVVVEVAAGVAVWVTGHSVWVPGPRPLAAVATVVWVVIVTNAFNLIDNMDGLAAGVAAITSTVLAVIAIRAGQYLVGSVALALAGSTIGFLRYNFQPARIYMGDGGSLFVGFVLAVLSLALRTGQIAPMSVAIPLSIVGIALFDTVLVTLTRVLNRRHPLRGGLDHTSHRLVFLGRSVRQSVGLVYVATVALGGAALAMTHVSQMVGGVLVVFVALLAAGAWVRLAVVPVYTASPDPTTGTAELGGSRSTATESELVGEGSDLAHAWSEPT